ncbi:MAG: aminopeptidase P family protein [Pseudomonadota bacterium]
MSDGGVERDMAAKAGIDDARLSSLLKEAGSPLSGEDAVNVLVGAASAPERFGDGWLSMLSPTPSAPLASFAQEARSALATVPTGLDDAGPNDGGVTAARVAALREQLAKRDLAGFIIPRADAHQGEYVPPHAQRLAWLTGFKGSAGAAIVLRDAAAIFIDGRYTLQVEQEVDTGIFEPRHLIDAPPGAYLTEQLKAGDRFAYDPWLHTSSGLNTLKTAAAKAGAELVECENLVDAIWHNQPPPPLSPVEPHPMEFAGRTAADKRVEIAEAITKAGAKTAVLSAPDSIAWLLNLRGGDLPRTPFALGFALVHAEDGGQVDLFMDPRKVTEDAARHLGNGVRLMSPEKLGDVLAALPRGHTVLTDPASTPVWILDRLKEIGAEIKTGDDPVAIPKACKNAAELEGIRAAHRRDGVALARFLHWLATEGQSGAVTELMAVDRLEEFRRGGKHFRDLSFDTISGAGPNGAIVHYRVNEQTNRPLAPGSLYLVDSGGQYQDGTTDVTRTIAIGTPTDEMRDRFTRVLKGHIALGTSRFPEGTTGSQLDVLARHSLWQAGLDYDHGTGHGVGAYLSVHEGPQRISKMPNRVALRPGMVVSNEPGYYKTGAYGIRIENLVAVVKAIDIESAGFSQDGPERTMLSFETLTFAPIDQRLVVRELLSDAEVAWLNAYHAQVREVLTPRLIDAGAPETAKWLESVTASL